MCNQIFFRCDSYKGLCSGVQGTGGGATVSGPLIMSSEWTVDGQWTVTAQVLRPFFYRYLEERAFSIDYFSSLACSYLTNFLRSITGRSRCTLASFLVILFNIFGLYFSNHAKVYFSETDGLRFCSKLKRQMGRYRLQSIH